MFSLESPHRGDSNENTKYTIFSIKKKTSLHYPKYAATGFFSKGIKNKFETAVVNEPSVFEPLKFYCFFAHAIRLVFRAVVIMTWCPSIQIFLYPSFFVATPEQGLLLREDASPYDSAGRPGFKFNMFKAVQDIQRYM